MPSSATPRGRGRPRKSEGLTESATASRTSSTKPSARFSRRLSSKAIADEDIYMMDDESLAATTSAPSDTIATKNTTGRTSLSSASPSLDYNEGSGYSTPATSAVATPAEQVTTSTRGRGRPAAPKLSAEEAVARAAALRNSKYSMAIGKRKRGVISDDEDEDEDEDDTPDAQMARRLQAEENAAGTLMVNAHTPGKPGRRAPRKAQKITVEDDTLDAQLARILQAEEDAAGASMVDTNLFGKPSRRAPRKSQKTASSMALPYDIADSQDDSDLDDDVLTSLATSSKYEPKLKVKVELGSKGRNEISFTSSKKATYIQDSEESEEFLEIDDSDDDEDFVDDESDAPIASTSRRAKKYFEISDDESDAPLAKVTKKKPAVKTGKVVRPPTTTVPVPSTSDVDDSDSDLSMVDMRDSSEREGIPAIASRRRRRRAADEPGEDLHYGDPAWDGLTRRARKERVRLERHHPELKTMWEDLQNLTKIGDVTMEQPKKINRTLKPFQLQGVAWMRAMENTEWSGGLLGDEMGMGKTIQAVSLIMSDWPAKQPSLVLIPPVALMQWQQEIASYTDGTLKTFVFHGTNQQVKNITVQALRKYDVILMSYNSLESMYRKQEKGFKRKAGLHREESVIHKIRYHRVILDEAHNIKSRTTGCAKACFALKADHKWCLSGTPLQNRIGEFFSLVRFLDIKPFACYFCKQCKCSSLNWHTNENNRCSDCNHSMMQHVSVFNQELLNPIVKYGNNGRGKEAFKKLRILTDRFMLRRVKRDHSSSMELPAKEIYVDRQFFGEEENDFASSIMNNGTRKFETYVAQGVMLNNYANIFGLIMQMRQVADHPDLILKKNAEGGQNVRVCCICDETAEEAIKSACKHDFCRDCARIYLAASDEPDCPTCHIPLSIDLEQPDLIQDEDSVKKSSIINRIDMANWTSSSKIEALVSDLHELRSQSMSHKSIIFSQFTTMLQLVEWRLRRAGITTVMLDGSMTPAQRQASINHFMTNVNVECFLVSLKAGGVALNLTEASHVFIVDPWWNPAAEWQSADRCHRIGQARPCSITRLCIEDSVESRMVLLQEKKANMINSTINADDAAMESLTPEDMQFLFRGN